MPSQTLTDEKNSTNMPGRAAKPAGRRGRRPAEAVRNDVLGAVGSILLTEGSRDLSFERIAREARVSKTTLYKWWPSIGALALDGYFYAVQETLAFSDTGDIQADLLSQLRAFTHVMTGSPGGRVLLELVGQSQTDADLAAAYRRLYSSGRRKAAEDRLRAAQKQGQLRAGIDVQVLVDQLWGAVYHRLLIPDQPVTDEFLTALVRNLFGGVAPVPSSGGLEA